MFISEFAWSTERAPSEVVQYGDLYLADQQNDIAGPHRLSVGTGLDTANTLRDIYNVQIQYAYEFYDYFEVGWIAKQFISQETSLKRRIDQEFDLIGLQVEGIKPRWASYLSLGVLPIKGRVNFFRKKTIPMTLGLNLGPGVRSMAERGDLFGWFWSIQNRFYLSSTLSFEVNLTQEMEAAFEKNKEKTTRHQINFLMGCSF